MSAGPPCSTSWTDWKSEPGLAAAKIRACLDTLPPETPLGRNPLAADFVEEFFDGSAANLVMSLLGSQRISRTDIQRLKRLMEERGCIHSKQVKTVRTRPGRITMIPPSNRFLSVEILVHCLNAAMASVVACAIAIILSRPLGLVAAYAPCPVGRRARPPALIGPR